MKKISFIITFLFLMIIQPVHADIKDYNGGSSASLGGLGSGNWCDTCVGLKISILNSNGDFEDSEVILNEKKDLQKPFYFSTDMKPKFKQADSSIDWINQSKFTYYTSGLIRKDWNPNDEILNFDKLLKEDSYQLLKNLLDYKSGNTEIFETLSSGDYIVVEPMTKIGQYYGTAFEFANAFSLIDNDCKSGSFCSKYSGPVFGGSKKYNKGGIFYNTIYVENNILGLEKYAESSYSSKEKVNRNDCFKKKTCGRGIGVYRYDDVYPIQNFPLDFNIIVDGKMYWGNEEIPIDFRDYGTFEFLLNGSARNLTSAYYYNGTVAKGTTYRVSNIRANPGYTYLGYNTYYNAGNTEPTSTSTNIDGTVNGSTQINLIFSTVYEFDINLCVDGEKKMSGFTDVYGTFDFKLNNKFVAFSNGVNWQGKMKDYNTFDNLYGTLYQLSNITAGSDYEYVGTNVSNKWTCDITNNTIRGNSVEGSIGRDLTSITIIYESTCDKRLANLKKADGTYNAADLFDLYKFYFNKTGDEKKDNRGLLNINNPSCTVKDPPSKEIKNLTCLSASTLSHANFNEFNLSNYDEALHDDHGNFAGFCLTSMYLKNNLGVQKFYSKSGQFLIKQENDNSEIEIYNSKYIPNRVCGTDVATTTIRKMCYVLPNRKQSTFDYSSDDYVTLYFGDNDVDGNPESLTDINSVIKDGKTGKSTTNELELHEYQREIKYKLNKVSIEPITGKIIDGGNNLVNGVISKFNSSASDEKIPFKIYYSGSEKTYGLEEKLCTYSTQPEIIIDNKLQLEYRIIDTKIPFNRNTMTNWSNGTDNSKDNDTVQKYIINKPNSYGIDENGDPVIPIYKITLTPTDIKNIREYNENVPYDNYQVECEVDSNGNEVCKNTFLENLENQMIIIYGENGNIVKTLTNSNSLITSNSNNSLEENLQSDLEIINGVDITKKICYPVSSSSLGNVPTGNYNIGDEYKCYVKDGLSYNFYVVGTCGDDKVNLIMDQNINDINHWISHEDYNGTEEWYHGYADWFYSGTRQIGGNNSKGPLTSLKILEESTNSWDNIVPYNYTLIDEINSFKNYEKVDYLGLDIDDNDPDFERYSPIERYDVRARMLSRNEASNCGCPANPMNCPVFLRSNVKNYGYWLSSAGTECVYCAYAIDIDSGDATTITWDVANGVRPVITVYKSQISN